MAVPTITLNNGVQIPQLGFGVFQIPPEDTKDATLTALDVGYRHIDTAEMYGNEKGVGEAVRESGIPRDEVFITSKLNNGFHAYDDALRAADQTLADLGVDVIEAGFAAASPASCAASTASYTSRCAGEYVPLTGRVRVTSAVNSESTSTPASTRMRSPSLTSPVFLIQCNVFA